MAQKVDLKVCLLGAPTTGKTSLVQRFLTDSFNQNYVATVGAAFGSKDVLVDGHRVTLGVWDTAGQERYQGLSKMYYRNAQAALVCYDITSKVSLEKMKFWISQIIETEEQCKIYIVGCKLDLAEKKSERGPTAPAPSSSSSSSTTTTVPSKRNSQLFPPGLDYQFNAATPPPVAEEQEKLPTREVSVGDARAAAQEVLGDGDVVHFECSAKKGVGVVDVFTQVARDYLANLDDAALEEHEESVVLSSKKSKKDGCPC